MKLFYSLMISLGFSAFAFWYTDNEQVKLLSIKYEVLSDGTIKRENDKTKEGKWKPLIAISAGNKKYNLCAPFFAPVITATKTVDKSSANPGDTLSYTVTINNTSLEDATGVTFTDILDPNTTLIPDSTTISPIAVNNNYNATGNVSLIIDSANGVKANDYFGAPVATITASTQPANGSVILNTDGSFTYTPNAGYEGVDAFTYTLTNSMGSSIGLVNITIANMIWFINNSAATIGDGRLATPFNTIGAFSAANVGGAGKPDVNDNIFIYESATDYVGSITLLNGQKLIGQDATSDIATIANIPAVPGRAPLPANNSGNPTIVNLATINPSTNAVNISSGASNTLRGFTVGNTTDTDIASAAGFGTLTVSEVALTGTGRALNLTGGTLNATFSSISSSSGVNGISLTNIGGFLTAGAGSIIGSTGSAFNISGGNATINYAGSITKSTAGRLVDIQNKTGNNITLSGPLSSTGSSAGINVSGSTGGGTIDFSNASKIFNTGASNAITLATNGTTIISFSGGGLGITTTSSIGFSATGGGIINVTGGSNTISSGTGTALNLSSVIAGADGLSYSTVSSNGAANGINLSSVTGTGSITISGGTINGGTGAAFNVSGGTVTATFAGTINQSTSGLNQKAVNIANATGGVIVFSGPVNSTNSSGGISLLGNSGATINFTGGINLSTGSNGAFTATGGGTITATQDNSSILNVITTTTGTALNVVNTTIGANGITFRSISVNGAPKGIILNNSGSNGGLKIIGTGTTAGSGGTIQSTTGTSIELINTFNTDLNYLRVFNTKGHGIDLNNSTNLKLINCEFDKNGDSDKEGAS